MPAIPAEPHGGRYTRDEEMKPGEPPRPAAEPHGGESSTKTAKTMTDPATGEPQPGAPAPAQADADEADKLADQ